MGGHNAFPASPPPISLKKKRKRKPGRPRSCLDSPDHQGCQGIIFVSSQIYVQGKLTDAKKTSYNPKYLKDFLECSRYRRVKVPRYIVGESNLS